MKSEEEVRWRVFGSLILCGLWGRAVSKVFRDFNLGDWEESMPGSKIQKTGGQQV